MTWFFERDSEVAACEVRRTASHFEIAIRKPEQLETVDVAHDARELFARLEQMPRTLLKDGWRPVAVRRWVSILSA